MASVLTAQSVERLKPDISRRLELPDAVLPGLYFVVQPSGVKSWAVRYRFGGKPRKLTLGPYPALDLTSARARGREALQVVALGRDPGAEKIAAARKTREADPVEDLVCGAVESFLARHVKPNTKQRSAEETERLFRKHILPQIGRKRLDEVKRRDIIDMLDRIVDAGFPVAANRALAAVRKFFNWALDRSLLEASPCLRVKAPAEETSRNRVLSDDEIRLIWRAAERIGAPFGPFVQLLLLTAQRRGEVAKMAWSELSPDGALWTIPAERTKNGIAQDVPLSAEARAVLEACPRIVGGGYVFTTSGKAPIAGYSKAKQRLDATMLVIACEDTAKAGADPSKVTLVPWRLHDLRRTAASGMARLGQPVHVIEAVLNHTSGAISGVTAIYNRHRYQPEKRAALEAWGQHVTQKGVSDG